jgi:pyruvate/2-oxoglutarate/acetoin dehydrogenase E1 component
VTLGSTTVQAARSGLEEAMRQDERVVVIGEDVTAGGPFTLTKGLVERYGTERVRNTPICEGAFTGASVGLALAGGRPFVDIMFNDFVTAASDQLFNNAAKIHYMSGGRYSVPLTVWTIAGAGTRWGAHHSQHLEGWLAQVPGLKVLAPSSPEMMRRSVGAALEDPDPVVIVADRSRLMSRDPLPGDDGSPWSARTIRAGSDMTLLASGRLAHLALVVADSIDVSVEVIDLQRLAPLDISAVIASLERTSRLAIVHDEAAPGPLSSMIASRVYDEGFWLLDAPIRVLTSPHAPIPAGAQLEDSYMIGSADIRTLIESVLAN